MQDLLLVAQWWVVFFVIGISFLPLTITIFKPFYDKGYLFSKVIGIAITSYLIFTLNVFRILKLNGFTIFFVFVICFIINFILFKKKNELKEINSKWKIFVSEEILFFTGIAFWTYIRAHEPSIHGLEKFMDFGFINSILRSSYLPSPDMWLPPFTINYYYFGHFIAALLTKASFLQSFITYNFMIATIFSFTFCLALSLLVNFFAEKKFSKAAFTAGLLGGIFTAFGGNLHTIYSIFLPYNTDKPLPFWALNFALNTFPNGYWYPNATRFIPFTIHEFPLYSFVVSDLHGHVSDIPFVLLTIALIYILFLSKKISKPLIILISLVLSIMYMTNAWDAFIYFILVAFSIILINTKLLEIKYSKAVTLKLAFFSTKAKQVLNIKLFIIENLKHIVGVLILFVVFSLPFSIHFKPFVSGIGVVCAPSFLTKIQKFGPFLFEPDHCQKSQFYQLLILYGFFYFFVSSFIVFLISKAKKQITKTDIFMLFLIIISTLLIIIPEFFYVKDIYPAHYRANTMFKLVYQSFIMLSISSAYIIVRILSAKRNLLFYFLSIIFILPVVVYPYFAIKSYYGDLKNYLGVDGISYLKTQLPEDYNAIVWINKNIKGQPVILEAQGDSYTDYARISSNTGLPTVLGWTVHEWLWRGTYDVPAPRIEEVKTLYETNDMNKTLDLLQKYKVSYVYVGGLEKQKYTNLYEEKFRKIGVTIYNNGQTKIYKVNSFSN